MNPMDFKRIIRTIVRKELPPDPYKIGRIHSTDGRILFDGENTPTTKKYAHISSYEPKLNERVLLARVKGSYVILGKIER